MQQQMEKTKKIQQKMIEEEMKVAKRKEKLEELKQINLLRQEVSQVFIS